jgi:sulfur carrier protein
MPIIFFKQQPVTLEKVCSLTDFFQAKGIVIDFQAVVINQQFIPRDRHASTVLKEGDNIELISPMQGG